MIDFYNAFISYRHAPLDSKIAEHVQRKLERFHVPHKLKKNLRHQKITRIFRDKDELPITSDLTETITGALRNAEYLIVICSTNTKESYWVKREIKTFLQTHTADKVLTVLCDGEPFEVIPEELLSMEKEYRDEMGIAHTVKVPVEPLSCDYRLPRPAADKEELPRLASALLGCSYDELQRRTRQYKIRRVTTVAGIVFAAMAVFVGYMIYSNKKINETYLESLRSRSLFLSNEAVSLLEDDKRFDAIHLALASLPNESNPKIPVTAEAVRAITSVTAAYQSNAGSEYQPVWNFKTDFELKKCIKTDDDQYIAALDESGKIYCWDGNSHQLLFKNTLKDAPVNMMFLGKEGLLITFKHKMESYDLGSGELLWKYEIEEDRAFYEDSVVYADNAIYFHDGDGAILKLSEIDGTVRETYQIKESSSFISPTVAALTISPDGKKIAYADSTFVLNDDKIHIYDTETGNDSAQKLDTFYIEDIAFADNDHLCVLTSDSLIDSSTAYSNELTVVQRTVMEAYCFDCSMTQKWMSNLEFTDASILVGSMNLPARSAVMFFAGNTAIVYDLESGGQKNLYQLPSSIITASDNNGEGLPEFICRHGEYVFALNENEDKLAQFNVLSNNLKEAMIGQRLYAAPADGKDIICYIPYLQDDEWEPVDAFGGFTIGSSYQTYYHDDEYLVIASRVSETHIIRISVIDPKTGKLTFTTDIDDIETLTGGFQIQRADGQLYAQLGEKVYEIFPDREKVSILDYTIDSYSNFISGGKLFRYSVEDSCLVLKVSDIDGANEREITSKEYDGLSSFSIRYPAYVKEIDTVFFPTDERLIAVDLASEKVKTVDVPDDWKVDSIGGKFYAIAAEDGSKVLLYDGTTIFVTDGSFKELFTMSHTYEERYSAYIKDDILYAISDDFLILYNSNTGEMLNQYEMTLYGYGDTSFSFHEKTHELFIKIGSQISIFDTDTWIETAFIENAYCYDEGADRFYVYSYRLSSECYAGYIEHYTLDDLIEKATKILGGQELPDYVKEKYGI